MPPAMATLRNLAISALKTLGATNTAKTTRAIRDQPQRALPILGITPKPDTTELDQALVRTGVLAAADRAEAGH